MLIASDRHTPADLALWTDLEEADRIHGGRPALGVKVKTSLAALREFIAKGSSYAGTSWGKDSVVLCHLLWTIAPQVPLVHLRPTNHNPDCDSVRDAYFEQWPGQSYSEIPVDYSCIDRLLPHQDVDRLTDEVWYSAIRTSEKSHGRRHILGIRADESFGRRIRSLRWGISSPNGCAPLAWWKTADVFGYLALHDLPVHSAYAMLGGGGWPRERLRVAEIGDTHGAAGGRRAWEEEYYPEVLRRGEARRS